MKKIKLLFLAFALAGASSASAVTYNYIGQYMGNDNPVSVVETIVNETGLTRLKVDEPASSDGDFSVTYDGGAPSTSGTWSYTGSDTIAYLAVKAGDYFNLYSVSGTPSGSWSTAGGVMTGDTIVLALPGNGVTPKEISHLSLYLKSGSGSKSMPDTGATVVLLGSALAGLGLIKRRK